MLAWCAAVPSLDQLSNSQTSGQTVTGVCLEACCAVSSLDQQSNSTQTGRRALQMHRCAVLMYHNVAVSDVSPADHDNSTIGCWSSLAQPCAAHDCVHDIHPAVLLLLLLLHIPQQLCDVLF
jgi:hypothetical protein